ncbi:hypothetical protein PG996_010904 [Apiospora saccharicola]|uniref:Clr5 domain-containing protein n=1 Tax=Apiospora saccharicola TaxID=335842 RepID=A0ABR1UPX7_9PEZI
MPLETRKIPQSEWDQHQHTIRALYHNQKLPLWHQKGGRCVIAVMSEEHGFVASLSQYEAQLRRWESQKNLKRHEWAFLLAQYDKLAARGCQPRIVSSGLPLSESRIARARRHLQSTLHLVGAVSSPRHAFVEFQNHRGDWSRYPAPNDGAEDDTPDPTNQFRPRNRVSGNTEWPQQSRDLTQAGSLASQETASSSAIPASRTWEQRSLQYYMRTVGFRGEAHAAVEFSSSRDLVARSTSHSLCAPIGPGADVLLHPIAQQMLGELPILTPQDTFAKSSTFSSRGSEITVPTLVEAIAYSFSNRTQITRRMGHDTVFGLLRVSEPLRQGLQDLLQTVHPSFGMCLADNLSRHAVETSDSQATKMVIDMARNRFAYVIDPNKIKCKIHKRCSLKSEQIQICLIKTVLWAP